MLMGINVPIRIGRATVLPGDVVLAKREGVIFIPPHLAELVCKTGELVQLRDMFGFQRIKEGTYTPGQIDQRWSDDALRGAWNRACEAAKLPGVKLYEGTKHSSATAAVRRGVSLYQVQAALGHADSRSTQRYAKLAKRAPVGVLRPARLSHEPDGGSNPAE